MANLAEYTLAKALILCLYLHVWLQFPRLVQSEVFSAIADLEFLVGKEERVLSILDTAISEGWEPQEDIEKIRKIFATHSASNDTDLLHPAEHPVDAFMLVKYWARLYDRVYNSNSPAKPLLEEIGPVPWPTSSDYIGSLIGMLRLQKTYLLTSAVLVSGTISGYPSRTHLEPDDLYELGKLAMKSDHKLALGWYTEALKLQDQFSKESIREMETDVLKIYEQRRDYFSALKLVNAMLSRDPDSEYLRMKQEDLTAFSASRQGLLDFWTSYIHPVTTKYEALCRGEGLNNDIRVSKDLICVYRKSDSIPYIRYKEEIHSFDTRISLFLDVISQSEAMAVRQLAYPLMARAGVGDPSNATSHQGRVSKTAWLFDEDPRIIKLSKRIKDITGLETKIGARLSSSEAFQVVNYGVGGQYETHYDYFTKLKLQNLPTYIKNTGDRVATFLFYLSDAKEGGSTVFPQLHVRVPPIKFAAAFWFNIKLSGEDDDRTSHAGCPILLGQKWVTNKWIREYGQEFRRQCALSATAIDPIWP